MINFKKKEKEVVEPTPEMLAAEKLKRRKKARRRKAMRIIDRIFGFFLATGIVVGCACLALEYIIVKGPSPSLSNAFVMTMLETRRFKWIPRIYLTGDEINEIAKAVNSRGFVKDKEIHRIIELEKCLLEVLREVDIVRSSDYNDSIN